MIHGYNQCYFTLDSIFFEAKLIKPRPGRGQLVEAEPKILASRSDWYVLLYVKFGSSVTRINRREPPKLGSAGSPPLEVGAWLTPKNKSLPHMCYHDKFGSSATKGVCINRKEPPN